MLSINNISITGVGVLSQILILSNRQRWKKGEKFKLSMGIDSTCLGSSLNPALIHKQVLIRKVSTKIHDLLQQCFQL